MKRFIWIPMLWFLMNNGFAQKAPIDTVSYKKWSSLDSRASKISNDGNYVMYQINNQPVKSRTLIITGIHDNWTATVPVATAAFFSPDSRKAIVTMEGDSLVIFTLGETKTECIMKAEQVRFADGGCGNWIAYRLKEQANKLVIRNLQTSESRYYNSVSDYRFDETGTALLVKTETGKDSTLRYQLLWVDLVGEQTKTIWEGEDCSNYNFDKDSKQLAFIVETKEKNEAQNEIWQYQKNQNKAFLLITNTSLGHGSQITSNGLSFSKDGNKLYFQLHFSGLGKQNNILKNSDNDVTIWSYKDKQLHTLLPFGFDTFGFYESVIDLASKKVMPLTSVDDNIPDSFNNNEHVLIETKSFPDAYYNKNDRPDLFLVSVKDGSRKLLLKGANSHDVIRPVLSPNEKFAIWFDSYHLTYYSYEIATGKKINLSKLIPDVLYDQEAIKFGRNYAAAFGIAGCSPDDRHVFIYGHYDIWKMDLTGKEKPVNITHWVGKEQHVVFTTVNQRLDQAANIIDPKKELLLGAYNRNTNESGYWNLNLTLGSSPAKCIMDAKHAYWIGRIGLAGEGYVDAAGSSKPIKARDAHIYLVERMSASESSNLFITTDLRFFKPVSDIHPEKQYNWLTSEPVKWKMKDGKMSQGILYKPENFNPKKKYPLIFTYYEKRSDQLNGYIIPQFSRGEINISSYVSNGYLVFVPDIYYKPGHHGDGAVNSVVSAAKYLSKYRWVDMKRLGLQGHSFGGFETDFLITHSNRFAAACEAAGTSDAVSCYSQLNGFDTQYWAEAGTQATPYGIGITPWTHPTLYIQNSPVFNIGKITTPLLIMHNPDDHNVPFEQAVELFAGMKRAGKKVWLLQYKDGGHNVDGKSSIDYTMRMQQFFDHYLKCKPAPEWMETN